ncbi:DUF4226 domain-containing protein [Mycolicibacterium goodii]|uniref:DUF4226 domain-containing protein n=1 Tax=Mycolicibacterium goodii TaxID=134601 RepID=UPI001BDC39D8|nr:DUF4226 domain-containing protein [Mycolicibacterium goodii]MBU8841448.1 DUF4226 domain-containing protein [Mycolicibacterium goodii]
MASYDDLRAALEHIKQVTGDPNAWQKGLSEQQIRDVNGWLNSQGAPVTTHPITGGTDYGGWRDPQTGVYYENRPENTGASPQVPDADLDRIRQAHPDLFDPTTRAPITPPPGAPVPPAPNPQHSPPAQAPGQPPAGTTPGQTPADDGLSGKAADAAKRVDEALAKNKTALAEADEELVDAVLGAKTGSDEGKAQLQALQSSLVDQIHKLGPTLDTPAGQQQLNDFLQSKTQEILGIVKSSGMDAESKAEVLDALSQRYDAVKDSAGTGGGPTDPAGAGAGGQTGSGTGGSAGAPAPAGDPGTSGAGDPLASDPLLNGLASDPLMGGLGGLAGPAMGALAGLPGAMGSMLPGMGGLGGGGGLGDLGGAIGGAIKDAASARPSEDPANELKDDPLAAKNEGSEHNSAEEKNDQPAPTDEGKKDAPATEPAAAKPAEGAQPQPIAAETGQVPPAQQGPDVSVKLPDGSTVTADSPQLAHAGRLVLDGASLDDAASQAQISVLPPGAPVNEPVSPSQLKLMDYAQFTDHRVMALGNGKVWLNGQVTPVEEMPTGPNFLGWARPQVQTAPAAQPATVLAGAH